MYITSPTCLLTGVSGTNTVPVFFTSGDSAITDCALSANFEARLGFSEKHNLPYSSSEDIFCTVSRHLKH